MKFKHLFECLLLKAGICAAERTSASNASCWNGPATAMARMCWASTSRAPGRNTSDSSSLSAIASSAARASRYSKRVSGNDDAYARLIQSVVGAADLLQQPGTALRCIYLNDQADIAPVDPEVEAGRRHETAQSSRGHRSLNPAPRIDREAAVMNADRKALVVHGPQILKYQLGEAASVAEDKCRSVLLDELDHLAHGMTARVTAPGDLVLRYQDREIRLRPGSPSTRSTTRTSAHRVRARVIGIRIADGRGKPDLAVILDASVWRRDMDSDSRSPRSSLAKPCSSSTTMVRRSSNICAVMRIAQQQAEDSGCGQQDLRRLRSRCLVLRSEGVSPVRVSSLIGKVHLFDRADQIALDIDGERLGWRRR